MVCPQTRCIALTATCDSAFPSYSFFFFLLILLLTVVNCENSEGASLGEELTFLTVFMLPYVGAILETFSLWWITWSRLSLARHPLWTDQSLSPSFVVVFWLPWAFVVESGLSCPAACGILVPWPGINLSPLRWKADSYPLDHQRSPWLVPSGSSSSCCTCARSGNPWCNGLWKLSGVPVTKYFGLPQAAPRQLLRI